MTTLDFECPYLQSIYSEERYVKIAWAAWLWNLLPWDYFVTLTYESDNPSKRPPGIPTARNSMRSYSSLFPALRGGIAAVLERGAETGRLHWHALMHEPWDILPQWRYGFAKWEPVKSERAAFYISKYVVKNEGDIVIQLPDKLRPMV